MSDFVPGIDLKKIKVKHLLGISSTLPNFPDESDLLYYLVDTISSNPKSDKTFTDVKLSVKFNRDREEINALLDSLSTQGYVKKLKDMESKNVYEILKNPYR
jgi:hypothetical protein